MLNLSLSKKFIFFIVLLSFHKTFTVFKPKFTDTSLTFASTQILPIAMTLAYQEHTLDIPKIVAHMVEDMKIVLDFEELFDTKALIDLEEKNEIDISEKDLKNMIEEVNAHLIPERHKYIALIKLDLEKPEDSVSLTSGIRSLIGKKYSQLNEEYKESGIDYVALIKHIMVMYLINKTSSFFVIYKHALSPEHEHYSKVAFINILPIKDGIYALLVGNSTTSHKKSKPHVSATQETPEAEFDEVDLVEVIES